MCIYDNVINATKGGFFMNDKELFEQVEYAIQNNAVTESVFRFFYGIYYTDGLRTTENILHFKSLIDYAIYDSKKDCIYTQEKFVNSLHNANNKIYSECLSRIHQLYQLENVPFGPSRNEVDFCIVRANLKAKYLYYIPYPSFKVSPAVAVVIERTKMMNVWALDLLADLIVKISRYIPVSELI